MFESPMVIYRIQGYLAHKKHPYPWYHHMSLGIGLCEGPRGVRFLVSEVPLQVLSRVVGVAELGGISAFVCDVHQPRVFVDVRV